MAGRPRPFRGRPARALILLRAAIAAGPRSAGPPTPNSKPLCAALDVSDVRGVLGAVLLAEPGGPGLSGAGGDAAARGRRRPVSGCDARAATRSPLPSAGPEPAGRRVAVEADPGTKASCSCIAQRPLRMDAAAGRSGHKEFMATSFMSGSPSRVHKCGLSSLKGAASSSICSAFQFMLAK